MEGAPLSNARDWLTENPLETIAVASRLFGVPDPTIRASIWNMDETGFRIRIPGGERVIVPQAAKELYTPSPENQTSITIIETVSAIGGVIPPILIILGKIHVNS
jgi:hypothetical protein